MNYGTAFGVYILSTDYNGLFKERRTMKKYTNRLILLLVLSMGTLVGMFRGHEARQKWVFRIKSRFEEKRHMAEQRRQMKETGVALDDVELAAFHNS